LTEYISAARAALNATNEEASKAKDAAAVTQAKLAGKSDFTFLGICLIWVEMVFSFPSLLPRC
jgi:hypothetical protein